MHIESRSSKRFQDEYEFIVEVDTNSGDMDAAFETLKETTSYLTIISRDEREDKGAVPWFPGKRQDLDQFANQILSYGSELDADHPVSCREWRGLC